MILCCWQAAIFHDESLPILEKSGFQSKCQPDQISFGCTVDCQSAAVIRSPIFRINRRLTVYGTPDTQLQTTLKPEFRVPFALVAGCCGIFAE